MTVEQVFIQTLFAHRILHSLQNLCGDFLFTHQKIVLVTELDGR